MKRKTEKNIYQSQVAERPVRKSVRLSASVIAGDATYDAIIRNISASGVGLYIDTLLHDECTVGCSLGAILTVEFTSPSGEFIALRCRICWLRIFNNAGDTITTSMGMKIIDPPAGFIDMYNSLI